MRMKAEGIPLLEGTHRAWVSPAFTSLFWSPDEGGDRTAVRMKAEGTPPLRRTRHT